MQVKDAVKEYRFAILNISEKRQGFYLQKLQRFAEWCEQEAIALEEVNQKQVARYIEYRRKQGKLDTRGKPTGKPHASHTLHGDARAIKVFLNWCAKDGDLEKLVAERTVARIAVPKLQEKIIEVFTTAQIQALLAACDDTKMKAYAERDKTIVALLLDTGIRAGELCTLTLNNLYLENPHDAYIRVHGKRDKWREVGLGVDTNLHSKRPF